MTANTRQRRILVVLAHPDDETFICGGALARYAADGHRITLICATRGEMGRRLGMPPIATREGLARVREQELRAACIALGIADLRFLGLRDKTIDYYDPQELAGRIMPMVQELQPAAVITFHEEIGGHPDHCAIGRATRIAWERSGAGARLYYLLWTGDAELVKRAGATTHQVTAIAVKGPAAAAKMRAFRAHRTQSELMDWLRSDKTALKRLSGREFFLQGSGPARSGEIDILP